MKNNNPYSKGKVNKKNEEHATNEQETINVPILEEYSAKPDEDNIQEELVGGGEIGILNKKIENLELRLQEKDDEILRRVADTDNYRKRLEKETDDRMKYANRAVTSDFIKVLDNIELTLQYVEKDSKLYEGIVLTIKSFKDTLEKYGVKEIDTEMGSKFDPTFHEGMMLDNDANYPNDSITLCVQKGYTLYERVIRPAKVRVNKI